jgi:hypothetical protein
VVVVRLATLLPLALLACTEEITPGAYLCGEEQLCPEGMACNGPDNVCVDNSQAQPFACNNEDNPDPPGDDAPADGLTVADLMCVSPIRESRGCLLASDPGDWYQFDVPANCVEVQIEGRLILPIAFEQIGMELVTEDGAPVRVDGDCEQNQLPDQGFTARCFKQTVTSGSHHALGLVHSGELDCGGTCNNNRYTLQLRLSTP